MKRCLPWRHPRLLKACQVKIYNWYAAVPGLDSGTRILHLASLKESDSNGLEIPRQTSKVMCQKETLESYQEYAKRMVGSDGLWPRRAGVPRRGRGRGAGSDRGGSGWSTSGRGAIILVIIVRTI